MRKKILISLVAGALLAVGLCFAQAGPDGRRGGFGMARMAKQLNLTDQQKTQIKSMREATHQQLQALRNDTSLTPEQKRERARQLMEQSQAQFQSVLTPEQQQQLKDMRAQAQQRGLDRMAKALNLSDQQKQQIQPILEAQHQQLDALRNNTSLTSDQRREQSQQLRQQTQSQINNILTPEQQQQAQQMRDRMGSRRHRGPGGFGFPRTGTGWIRRSGSELLRSGRMGIARRAAEGLPIFLPACFAGASEMGKPLDTRQQRTLRCNSPWPRPPSATFSSLESRHF